MRVNRTFTVGTDPINIISGTAAAPDPNTPPMYANRLFVQMLAGASAGLGYVMDGVRVGRLPLLATDNDVTAQLAAAASATAPGGTYTDSDFTPEGGIDLRQVWVHGAHAGDKIKVSWNEKV